MNRRCARRYLYIPMYTLAFTTCMNNMHIVMARSVSSVWEDRDIVTGCAYIIVHKHNRREKKMLQIDASSFFYSTVKDATGSSSNRKSIVLNGTDTTHWYSMFGDQLRWTFFGTKNVYFLVVRGDETMATALSYVSVEFRFYLVCLTNTPWRLADSVDDRCQSEIVMRAKVKSAKWNRKRKQ